jgi:5-methylcytosine-specific restriction protein A
MSASRVMKGGRAKPAELQQGPNGRNLCRWCALEVPAGRRTFCSAWCVHEWRLRTDPGYLRQHVFSRDKGMCAGCTADTESERRRIKRLHGQARSRALARWGLKPGYRWSLWDADHIVPVAEGGGECDLTNIRTLCLRCHRQVTAELRERLKARRKQSNATP